MKPAAQITPLVKVEKTVVGTRLNYLKGPKTIDERAQDVNLYVTY